MFVESATCVGARGRGTPPHQRGEPATARLVLATFIAWTALLWLPANVVAAAPDLNPLEPPDTSSPRATLQTFLETMQEASRIHPALLEQYRSEPGLAFSPSAQREFDRMVLLMQRAAECLDVSEVPPRLTAKVTVESTLLLKEIFDRVELPPLEAVPDAEAAAEAGLERWRIPHTEIVIAKVKDGDRAGEFLFSPGTVRRLPEFYEKVRALPYRPGSWKGLYAFFTAVGSQRYIPWKLTASLPAWAKARVWDQALWRWIVLGAAFFVGSVVLIAIIRRVRRPSAAPVLRQYLRRLLLPVSVSIFAGLLSFLVDATNVTGTPRNVIATLVGVLWLLSAAWAILLLANMAGEAIAGASRLRARAIDQAIARLGSRVLGFLFAVAIVLYGAQLLGLPVTPLLGALGVGSLAVALAAQPTIENFIAGITLYADRPVRVGDFCRFGDTVGTVENIGMRSTHIRTLDDTVVSVPNGEFSKARLENFSRRTKLWYHPRIRLRYETTPDQVRYILVEAHKLLYSHPKVIAESARIRFVQFGDYSLDLDVFAYIDVVDYREFLEAAEDLNLRMMEVVKASGTELAVPAQIQYRIAKESLSDERVRNAEEKVSEWRAGGALYVPRFPPEKIAELKGSLDYPPAGSPGGGSVSR